MVSRNGCHFRGLIILESHKATRKKILIFVGPSGSGKTTIGEKLSELGYKKLVTTTTRKPRSGESEGVDYYFRETHELNDDDFIEQTQYNQKTYGLTKKEVDDSLNKNDIVHVCLDRNGAKVMKKEYPDEAVVIFINISQEEMINRMQKRGDSEIIIQERIDHCNETGELDPPEETDFIVQNHDMKKAVTDILHIIDRIK